MSNRAGLFPIICLITMLLAPTLGRAADEPAATAAIPPPAPSTVVHTTTPLVGPHGRLVGMHRALPPPTAKATAGSHAKPRHVAVAKREDTRTAARVAASRKPAAAQRQARHHPTERRPVVVHVAPQPAPPPTPPRDYAGAPVLEPNGPPPPFPPWYDRARPAIAFAYPPPFIGPRGPMPPWWVR